MRSHWLIALIVMALAAIVTLVLYARLQALRKREVEETAHAKDRYYTILSHDLRNPMMAQQQVLQMLHKTTEGQTKVSIGKLIASNGAQLELLGNLQELAMLQLGKRILQPTRLDLGGLVGDTVAAQRNISDLKDIAITTQVQRTLVSADRETIRTVLRNLISNAIKFSREGSTIEVGTCSNSFFVRDHGIGMSDERIKALLSTSGSLLSEMGTSGENGTGIGLPLCLELVKLNNGSLEIQSSVGNGTTITVRLPQCDSPTTPNS